ncbi:arginine--tRNA ligase [candidate division WWE3 bacterium]|nr:arginine--tRNA ligase [candidate division WWE3 bacterium]
MSNRGRISQSAKKTQFRDSKTHPQKGKTGDSTVSGLKKDVPSIIKESLISAVKDLYDLEFSGFEVTVPDDSQWGDYTSNLCLQLSGQLKQNPHEIAKKVAYRMNELADKSPEALKTWSVSVAGPGFLNFKMSNNWLQIVLNEISKNHANYRREEIELSDMLLAGKKITVEYTDPNPFKLFHIGHLMPNAIGESFTRLFEYCGGEVKRASYQGDAGMHVAKSIWGMEKKLEETGLTLGEISTWSSKKQVTFLGECYSLGATAYKEDPSAAEKIKNYNYLVFLSAQENLQESKGWEPQVDYRQHLSKLTNPEETHSKVKELFQAGREWSLEYFETVYELLGTDFDFYYFESETGEYGFKIVQEYLRQGVFEKDKGAVIFKGEDYGLHTRVFINSQGLPTYEAKDLGLAFVKQEDYAYDLSYIVTGNEIDAYFDVVLTALNRIAPELAEKTHHVSHGMLRLTEGKMSSRTGNVVAADDLVYQLAGMAYEKTAATNPEHFSEEEKRDTARKIAVGALKYALLKQQVGKDIVYDRTKSLELTGNTGPYLQYTFVRVFSILEQVDFKWDDFSLENLDGALQEEETLLLRKLTHFNEIVRKSSTELMPSYLCTYLHELAGLFNSFYARAPILKAENVELRNFRLCLSNAVGVVLKVGLDLLGIETVERM